MYTTSLHIRNYIIVALFISFVNNILNNVLDENKKIVIKKYNEIHGKIQFRR